VEFLSIREARTRSAEVRGALRTLMTTRAVVGRPGAQQWRFLAACVERVLAPAGPSEFDALGPARAAQLKFEVSDRLRRHYLRHEPSEGLAFALVHRSEMGEYRIRETVSYPDIAGYAVLIREPKRDSTLPPQADALADYLERVVAEAVDSEFRFYALGQPDPATLQLWFCAGGPALREIVQRAERRREQGWIISNPLNPSTRRLLAVKVRRVTGEEAVVGSTQYWYLRWWSTRTSDYIYAFRQTTQMTYVLRREDGTWRVYENLKPSPRTVGPNRRAGQRA
jgi:hypothetical protein